MFNFLKRNGDKSPENKFWDWFVKNKIKVEEFIRSDHRDYNIYHKLNEQIKIFNELLNAELTVNEANKYVLIITPDGMKKGVEPTKVLAAAAPEIDGWEIKKFRQPSNDITLNFSGVEFPSSDIEILPQLDKEQELVHLNVFIRNMPEDGGKHKSLAFLYFDHILGEFNTITKVGAIEFISLTEGKSVENSISLVELRNMIAEELY